MKTLSVFLVCLFTFVSVGVGQSIPEQIEAVSVGVRASQSEGSAVVVNRTLKDGNQVTIAITAAHVVSSLKKTSNNETTFDDANIVKQIVDNGRKVGELTLLSQVKKYSDPDKEHDIALLLLRKSDYFQKSATFYLGEEIPPIGKDLFHVGSMLGTNIGYNSVTKGIISSNGRLLNDKIFDQFSGGSTSGSSGGGLFLADTGEYCGQLQRGPVNVDVMGYYAPIRRLKDWAKKEKVMWVFDQNSTDLPTKDELEDMPILSERMRETKKESGSMLLINEKVDNTIDFLPFQNMSHCVCGEDCKCEQCKCVSEVK